MDPLVGDWLIVALRRAHVITGIAWIGSSFFLMWPDSCLEPPSAAKTGAEGELWMIHGGGIYITEKRKLTPAQTPATLHWFKWEAAVTWFTGVLLHFIIYHAGASVYPVDPAAALLSPVEAVPVGVCVLVVSRIVVLTCGAHPTAATGVSILLSTGLAFRLGGIFSGRGACTHVGAGLGTIMAANVWVRIIPAQRQLFEGTTQGTASTPPSTSTAKTAEFRPSSAGR